VHYIVGCMADFVKGFGVRHMVSFMAIRIKEHYNHLLLKLIYYHVMVIAMLVASTKVVIVFYHRKESGSIVLKLIASLLETLVIAYTIPLHDDLANYCFQRC